jgi:hypothetical protein
MAGTRIRTEKKTVDQQCVAWVTLESDNGLHVLDTPAVEALVESVRTLADDESIRVLVLTGLGERAFIGGADIREMRELTEASAHTFISLLQRCCGVLHEFPVPVIARINGLCLGAGLEIAACCDLRIAVETAQSAMRRSQHAAISRPAPRHRPLIRAITGTGNSCSTPQHRCNREIKVCADASVNSRISRISAPPINARSPNPVNTRTRIDSSSANVLTDSTNASTAGVSNTWRPLSDSSVTQATHC